MGKDRGTRTARAVVTRGLEMWDVDVYEVGGRSVSQVNVMLTVMLC